MVNNSIAADANVKDDIRRQDETDRKRTEEDI